MRIAFISAMELELEPLLYIFKQVDTKTILQRTFYFSNYGKTEIIFVCTGQGKTNSSIYTQLLISEYKIDYIINIGICGSINPNINIFDILVGKTYTHYDIRKKQSITKFPYKQFYSADSFLLSILKKNHNIIDCNFGTGEGFICDELEKDRLKVDFNIDCVDMESASIAQTSYLNKIGFISLRIVSDKANNEAKKTTEQFQRKAMQLIQEIIQSFLNDLINPKFKI
ncbi:5'-methylthioadenosine/S-adenosylhomocysteine nucleosidase [Vagococcus fluvialis]|uniref:5'-methylthioadenosine/S-adenosylhomocysteine nucleosidase n=1 Tax=Vagococcus fluvialis TaxID=2738 RepID=UPI003B59CD78